MIRILLAPLSSALFFNDLVTGSIFYKKESKSQRATRKQAAHFIQGHADEDNQTQSVLLNSFEQLKKHHGTIRSSIIHSLMANLCRCKSRAHRARIKAQGPYSSELDVTRLINNSVGYRSFIKAFLKPQQKVWLANQRSKFVSLQSDSNPGSSENDSFAKSKYFAKLRNSIQNQ